MANYYFVYDQYGNIVTATDAYPQLSAGQQLLCADETIPNATAAFNQRHAYMVQNGQIVPAATIQINRTHAVNGSWDEYTLAITTSDAAAHEVTLSYLNVTETLSVPSGGSITHQVAIHQAVASSQIEITATGAGLVTSQVPIGGTTLTAPPLQTYTDANGLMHVAPTQKIVLVGYYGAQINPALILPDLSTSDGMLMQAIFGIILPALTGGATPLVTLDANQQNAVKDIQANVLPNIVTTLENAAPVPATGQPQTYDLHYHSYQTDLAVAKQAFDQYVQDVQNIPNLV